MALRLNQLYFEDLARLKQSKPKRYEQMNKREKIDLIDLMMIDDNIK